MVWKNDTGKTIYADAEGNLVEENDPNAAVMVAAPNVAIPEKIAKQYGLIGGKAAGAKAEAEAAPAEEVAAPEPAPVKEQAAPTGTKAVKSPSGNK